MPNDCRQSTNAPLLEGIQTKKDHPKIAHINSNTKVKLASKIS